MKASELVAALQTLIDEHGDHPVELVNSEFGDCTHEIESALYFKDRGAPRPRGKFSPKEKPIFVIDVDDKFVTGANLEYYYREHPDERPRGWDIYNYERG